MFLLLYYLSTMLKVGDAEINKTSWMFSRSWHFSQRLSWWHLWSTQGNKEASGIHCFIVWEYGTQLLPLCSWSVSEVLGGEYSFLGFLQKRTKEYLHVLRICYYICFRQNGDQNKTINNKVKTYIKTKEFFLRNTSPIPVCEIARLWI